MKQWDAARAQETASSTHEEGKGACRGVMVTTPAWPGPAREPAPQVALEVMTERKPPQMKFQTWIDRRVFRTPSGAACSRTCPVRASLFNIKPGAADGDYGAAWLRDYAQRAGVGPEEMPTPLRLRREMKRPAETAGEFHSEAEVREAAADLNRRIVEWRRITGSPPPSPRPPGQRRQPGRSLARRCRHQASRPHRQPAPAPVPRRPPPLVAPPPAQPALTVLGEAHRDQVRRAVGNTKVARVGKPATGHVRLGRKALSGVLAEGAAGLRAAQAAKVCGARPRTRWTSGLGCCSSSVGAPRTARVPSTWAAA